MAGTTRRRLVIVESPNKVKNIASYPVSYTHLDVYKRQLLNTQEEVTEYILNEAKIAIVPFQYFGADKSSNWYRLSVGVCKKEEIEGMLQKLRKALEKLN